MAKPDREEGSPLPAQATVSIVIATYDRPDDLRCCLSCLVAQNTSRQVEIIVVDNHPASGLTPPVVSEFESVTLICEPRRGLAYGRNAGFLASRGDIAVTTDDDVVILPDWLEKLIQPFTDEEVMVVTGNILPLELETEAQRLFEGYGGLGRGFERKVVGLSWFRSFRFQGVPTWRLGATANAAFRKSIFSHPEIGLMFEVLGPGMPSGVGEDTYLFYKVLKAGYKIVYEPAATVWHKHRRTMPELRRQIYNYSKGHVAYHLTTFLRDSDLRALLHVFVLMLPYRFWQVFRQIARPSNRKGKPYSLSMLLVEIAGFLAGPWALWKSYRLVKRLGQSGSLLPVSRRLA